MFHHCPAVYYFSMPDESILVHFRVGLLVDFMLFFLLISIARSSCRVISKYLMFQQWRTLYTIEELFQRHNSIYKAFLTRDPRLIEEAVRAHYAESAERLASLCEAKRKPKTPRSHRKAHFPTE